MRHFLNPAIDTIFLILGTSCNLNCVYCLQCFDAAAPSGAGKGGQGGNAGHGKAGDIGGEDGGKKIPRFIEDMARNQESDLTVQFYGGEPLLYFDSIRRMVEGLRHVGNVRFSIITNGTLITPERVAFFNKNRFSVAVSWDGLTSEKTRGVDVFAEKEELLLGIENLGLSSVISAYTYPFDVFERYMPLDAKYFARHGRSLGLNLDEIMDTGLADRALLDVDHAKLHAQMTAIAGEYAKWLRNEAHNPYYRCYTERRIGRIKAAVRRRQGFRRAYAACCNGFNVLNLDMRGNLHKCHNIDSVLGTIDDSYYTILHNALLQDNTREFGETCGECPVVSLCSCGCPLMTAAVREESYCAIKKASYMPFIELLMQYHTPE